MEVLARARAVWILKSDSVQVIEVDDFLAPLELHTREGFCGGCVGGRLGSEVTVVNVDGAKMELLEGQDCTGECGGRKCCTNGL